jgi:hypothetical protein
MQSSQNAKTARTFVKKKFLGSSFTLDTHRLLLKLKGSVLATLLNRLETHLH